MDNKPLIAINIYANSHFELIQKIKDLHKDFIGDGIQMNLPTQPAVPSAIDIPTPVVPAEVKSHQEIVEHKPKRGRKPKYDAEVEATPVIPAVEVPPLQGTIVLQTEVKQPTLPTYSLSEFQLNFPIILNEQLLARTLTPLDISEYCEKYGVKFIYELSGQHEKLATLFNDLVSKQLFTVKAEY